MLLGESDNYPRVLGTRGSRVTPQSSPFIVVLGIEETAAHTRTENKYSLMSHIKFRLVYK